MECTRRAHRALLLWIGIVLFISSKVGKSVPCISSRGKEGRKEVHLAADPGTFLDLRASWCVPGPADRELGPQSQASDSASLVRKSEAEHKNEAQDTC